MTAPDPVALAAAWRGAVVRADFAALADLYAPDALVRTNLDDRAHPLDDHLRRIAAARSRCDEWAYEDVRCEPTEAGYVSRHRVRTRIGRHVWTTVAAVFATLDQGRIVVLEEYLTPPRPGRPSEND